MTLEQQVEQSFSPWSDMGLDLSDAVARVATDQRYVKGCAEAYGSSVNVACVTKAIAVFERSLISGGSRFDFYLYEGNENALSPGEKRGWELFNGRAGCINCHDVFHPSVNVLGGAYATFSDERFHNLGVGYTAGQFSDPGRYDVSRASMDMGTFKTPMLRNVSLSAPYMHDGSFPTLESVIDFYNEGGRANFNKSRGLTALFLTEGERADLVAFLKALESPFPRPNGHP